MQRVRTRTVVVILTILLCVVLERPGPGAVGEAMAASYQLGPRDIINVTIFAGGEKQVDVDLTVANDGAVNFPFVGTVKTSGLTVTELEKRVFVPLERDYFVDPQVHIGIKEYHSLHFSISGAVKKPGKYEMQAATTILDLIAKAEGITLESGNIAYVMREVAEKQENTEPIRVNLVKLLDEGDMSHNVNLTPGDSVYIPYAKGLNQSDSKVYVSGEVKKPDLYEYNPGLTALSVCIMAGGFDKYAAPNRTTIVRIEEGKQKVIKIDLEDVIKGTVPDVPLKPGDRIHVPESWL